MMDLRRSCLEWQKWLDTFTIIFSQRTRREIIVTILWANVMKVKVLNSALMQLLLLQGCPCCARQKLKALRRSVVGQRVPQINPRDDFSLASPAERWISKTRGPSFYCTWNKFCLKQRKLHSGSTIHESAMPSASRRILLCVGSII